MWLSVCILRENDMHLRRVVCLACMVIFLFGAFPVSQDRVLDIVILVDAIVHA